MNELPGNAVPTEYAGYYVTPEGDVWSTRNWNRANKMIPQPNRGGYRKVHLTRDGVGRGYLVHRLVAETLLPNPEGKEQINHIDGDKTNNALVNLEWVTRQENMTHAANVLKCWGDKSYYKEARRLRSEGMTYRAIGNLLGVAQSAVYKAVNYERDLHV